MLCEAAVHGVRDRCECAGSGTRCVWCRPLDEQLSTCVFGVCGADHGVHMGGGGALCTEAMCD